MALYTTHLPKWKRDEVERIKAKAQSYAVMGLVDFYGIPATQMQQMRRDLRQSAELRMTRNTLIEHALMEMGGDVEQVKEFIEGQSALIFTNENPFKLYRMLERTKTKMVAKPGDVAPEDIVISKGPTSFKPGPIVGELQQAGIPAAIEGGKVKIRETKTAVRKGEVISKKMADVLAKLNIRPIDVGLSLQVAFYDNAIYPPSMLMVDEEAYFTSFMQAALEGFNLSVNIAYPTTDTIRPIIGKAVIEARALGLEACIYEKDLADLIISRAYRETLSLAIAASEKGFEMDEALKSAAAAAAAQAEAPKEEAPAAPAAEEEEKEDKEKEDEESGVAGLGALFG
jgi:large subunit ribosomal protein L10